MTNEQVKLTILFDILKEKKELLNLVQNICDNQKTILSSSEKNNEILHYFKETAIEKQKSIDKILSLDESFNNTYEQVKDIFLDRTKSLSFKTQIKEIQKEISAIEMLTAEIKALEHSNDLVVDTLRKSKAGPSKHALAKINSIYKKSNK